MVEGRLKVALDVAPVRREPAGVGVYVSSLARSLSERDDAILALIGVRPDASALDDLPASIERTSFRAPALAGRTGSYHAWLQLRAAADVRLSGAQLAHFTNASAPLSTALPFVVTVHDLSVIRLPHLHRFERLATVPVMLAAIARARAVIVPSEWVRRELVSGLRVAARRVVTVEHAASPELADGEATDEVLARLSLAPRDYLLAVGTLEPRKNIVRLVGAFERLARESATLKLVLVGAPGWRRGAIDRRIEASPNRDRIVRAGYLSNGEVAGLIRHSAAVCYVSIYEGYGLPVIEALAVGAPVVTSNRTGMVQAAGGAAVLVDPFDEDDIARGIREAVERCAELGAMGRARAARRAWADVADEHARIYRWAIAAS